MDKKSQGLIFDFDKFKEELLNNISVVLVKKTSLAIIVHLILAALTGALLLTGAYMLPVNQIDYHVRISADIIEEEGSYPRLSEIFTSQLDNYTDSIMLLEAANNSVISPLIDAMNAPRGYIEEHRPNEVLTAHYIDEVEFDRTITYPRYWHGYQIFLKPLLTIVDYSTIRIINGIVQLIFVILTCYLLVRKKQKKAIIPYMLSYGMLMPLALAKSLQFSTCFYVFTVGCIFMLILPANKWKEKSCFIFLYCGILTAYFDLLTYPITTFGVPMIFYLLLAETDSPESKIRAIIQNGLFWCIGFGCMWAGKWVIGSLITGNNVILDGVEKVISRTSTTSADGSVKYGLIACEIQNYKTFFTTPVSIGVVLYIGSSIFKCFKDTRCSFKHAVRTLLPFILTGFAPIVWYAFATNHSSIHFWFTNKACIVSLMAILFGLVTCRNKNSYFR